MIFKWPCRRAKRWYVPVVVSEWDNRQQVAMDRDWEKLRNENTVLRRNVERLKAENKDLIRREVKALERVARFEESARVMDRTFRRLVRIYYKNRDKYFDDNKDQES